MREHVLTPAVLIFDLEDRFAREWGVRGRHPRPLSAASFRAVERVDGARRQALDPPVRLAVLRNPSGFYLYFGKGLDGPGPAVIDGTYVIEVEAEGYQSEERELELPRPAEPVFIDLDPDYRYPFPNAARLMRERPDMVRPTVLRGGVRHTDGRGVEDARVTAEGAAFDVRTGPTGEWALLFRDLGPDPGPRRVTVAIRREAGGAETRLEVPVEVGRHDNRLPATVLRGHVLVDGVPTAATIEVERHEESIRTRGDGRFFFYVDPAREEELAAGGPIAVTATARLAGGGEHQTQRVRVVPRKTVVVPTFAFQNPPLESRNE